MINNLIINNLAKEFDEVSLHIKEHINKNYDLFIKFHYDADGINSFLMLNNTIRSYIKSKKKEAIKVIYSTSKYPNYSNEDIIKDSVILRKLNHPLIIIIDFGSQDYLSYELLKSLGYEVIVIDHHPFDIGEFNKNKEVFKYLINPHKHNLDLKISAGVLVYEITKRIFDKDINKLYNLISLVGDKCEYTDIFKNYNNLNEDLNNLRKLSIAFDYLAFAVNFNMNLFIELTKNYAFLDTISKIIYTKINQRVKEINYIEHLCIDNTLILKINLDLSYGFPYPSKLTGLIHSYLLGLKHNEDYLSLGKTFDYLNLNKRFKDSKADSIITMGFNENSIFMRISHPKINFNDILKELKILGAEGGGHREAGTLRMNNVDFALKKIESYIKKNI